MAPATLVIRMVCIPPGGADNGHQLPGASLATRPQARRYQPDLASTLPGFTVVSERVCHCETSLPAGFAGQALPSWLLSRGGSCARMKASPATDTALESPDRMVQPVREPLGMGRISRR